ncbi:MAG: HupE/UreJ family protein [Burkholderiales bacterium]|nr:HupE/UreJ family protein [Burkholderiales bacterium]
MRRLAPARLAGAFLLVPGIAFAHESSTGLGPVADGFAHLFLGFDDLLAVVAMAMLAGLGGRALARRVTLALPAAWLVGGVAGWLGFATRVPASATALSLLLVGILVAADRRAPSAIPLALAAGVGLMHGALNGAALAGAGGEALLALAGTAGAVLVVSLLVSRGASSVTRPWQRVAVRAAGSWIAAIGLLYLGWALKGS